MKLFYSTIILLFSFFVNAQNLTFDWAKSLGGPNEDHSNSIAVDGSGNVYTSGTFIGIADLDPSVGVFNLSTSAGNQEKYVSKLDASGNFVWAIKSVGGIIKFDPVGNIVLFNSDSIIKLTPTGSVIWRKGTIAIGGLTISNYEIDAVGDIYLVGGFSGLVDFNTSSNIDTLRSESTSGFILKLDNLCNFVWVKALDNVYVTPFGFGNSVANTIEINSTGDLLITGDFLRTIDFDPSITTYTLSTLTTSFSSPARKFILKLDASGNFVWAKDIGNLDFYYVLSTTCESSNFYLTGSDGVGKALLSKFDLSGNHLWTNNLSGSGSFGKSVKTDVNNNVYLMGVFTGTCNFNPGGAFFVNSVGSFDGFISKYDSNGNFIFTESFGGTSYDNVIGADLDGVGNVYITGDYFGTSDFDPSVASYSLTTAAGSNDAFVLKLGNTVIGIEEYSKNNSLIIYPNPNNGVVIIKTSSEGSYELINALGQTIKTFKLNSNNHFTISIDDLQQGIYYVVGKENNQSVSQKIIVIE